MICRLTSELATLSMFLNVNLRLICSTLPKLPSHVTSPRLRITFQLHMARYKVYIVFKQLFYETVAHNVPIMQLSSRCHGNRRRSQPPSLNRIFISLVLSGINKQLSQGRQTARSLMLFQLTYSVIRKIMHKIGLLGHPVGASGAIYALYLKFLTQRNLVAEFH